MKHVLLTLLLLLNIFGVYSQVTIGSGNPPAKAALLDLKEKEPEADNITSEKGGLLLPRVALESKTTLMPFIANDQDFVDNVGKIKDKHTGLVVYNLTNDPNEDLCPGTYEWSGTVWERLSKPCAHFEFLCSTISTSQYFENVNTPFNNETTILYNSGSHKELTQSVSHAFDNGLTLTVPPQTIQQTDNGLFRFYVSGDGTTHLGYHMLPLSELNDKLGIESSSSCLVSVAITLPPLNLLCDGISTVATVGTTLNTTVQIPYSLSRIPYNIPVGDIGEPVNGITPTIAAGQTLSTATGNIAVTLQGVPAQAGKTSVPITIAGVSCTIEVDVKAPFEFLCSTIATSQYIENEHTAFEKENSIRYNSKVELVLSAPIDYPFGKGLSVMIMPQTISQGDNKLLEFKVLSDGTTPRGLHVLSLEQLATDLGLETTSACFISVIITQPQLNLDCNAVSITTDLDIPMNKTINIPYSIDQFPYTIPAGNIGGTVSGITPSIAVEQTLSTGTGFITVTLQGSPRQAGNILVPITIGGATCNINVNVSAEFELKCTDVYITGFVDQDVSETSATVKIPYTLISGMYRLYPKVIGEHYGITATVEDQVLLSPQGEITVKLEGIPVQSLDKVPFTINIEGNSCSIHLSVITPPSICPDGKVAKAFVFNQNSKWYVVTGGGFYNISPTDYRSVAQTIECNTEEEALRHPDALQYCGNLTTNRCIKLFNRQGAFVTNIHMTQESGGWLGNIGIAVSGNSCWASIVAYGGGSIQSTVYKVGYMGAVMVTDGIGYLGVLTSGSATMTDKPLR